MKIEQTECSEMLAYKIQTQRNYRKESIQVMYYLDNPKPNIIGRKTNKIVLSKMWYCMLTECGSVCLQNVVVYSHIMW